MKKAKEDWVNRKCYKIDICFTHNNTKKAHQIVKDLTKSKYCASMNIQDKDENCINDENDILIRWNG